MGKCEDCIFISIGLSIKFLEMFVMFTGPVLVVGVYILFGLHAYGFLVQYTLYYFPQRNIYTTAFETILQILLIGLGVFNFTMCVIRGPGKLKQLENEVVFELNEQNIYTNKLETKVNESRNLEGLLCFKNKRLEDLYEIMQKKCRHCNQIKPLRTHHCTICKSCVLKMDHHCPWINNCVGLHNARYFLLFNFYTMLLSIHSCILLIFADKSQEGRSWRTFDFLLTLTLSVSLALFVGWNWFLAFRGETAIEFWNNRGKNKLGNNVKFSYNDWTHNLFIVFGTYRKGINIEYIVWQMYFVPPLANYPQTDQNGRSKSNIYNYVLHNKTKIKFSSPSI